MSKKRKSPDDQDFEEPSAARCDPGRSYGQKLKWESCYSSAGMWYSQELFDKRCFFCAFRNLNQMLLITKSEAPGAVLTQ